MDRSRPAIHHALIASALFLGVACGDQLQPESPVPALDRATYADVVQPILERGCSNPSSCHGRADRPLSIYAPRAYRAEPGAVFTDPPLTSDELDSNFDRTRGFAIDNGGGPELLSKPLAEGAGGARHEGGDVFQSMDDREYRAIQDWIRGGQ